MMNSARPCAEATLAGLIVPVANLARQAGARILQIYQTDFAVERKDDDSPLTKADLASHGLLTQGLHRLTPELAILSEESGAVPFATRRGWRCYWLVDPLDGTKEFVKRNGEFTVNVALVSEHRPVLGVVYAPVLDTMYWGAVGSGAYKQTADGHCGPIHVRPLPSGPVTVAGSRSHGREALAQYLERLGPHRIQTMGSSLKLCLVAEGEADLYPRLGPTSEWDTAAAQAVVEAAGGHVTDTAMQPLRYNTKESLLNPHFLVFGDASRDWAGYLDGA